MLIFADQEGLQGFFRVCRRLYKAKTRQNKAKYISMLLKYLPGSKKWTSDEIAMIERSKK